MTNVPRSLLETPKLIPEQIGDVGVRNLRLLYVDDSLANRLLNTIAAANEQMPAAIKNSLTTNMPVIMASITNPTIRNRMIFAALAFVNDPKSLTMWSTLNEPVPLTDIIGSISTDAKRLPDFLKLDFAANRSR